MRPTSILFVCTGNTCRSAMAAAWVRQNYPDIRVDSAGVVAARDTKAPKYAQDLFEDGALESHRTKPIADVCDESFDAVVYMHRAEHRSRTLDVFAEETVRWIGEDVKDPAVYGRTSEDYRQCFDQITRLIRGWLGSPDVLDAAA